MYAERTTCRCGLLNVQPCERVAWFHFAPPKLHSHELRKQDGIKECEDLMGAEMNPHESKMRPYEYQQRLWLTAAPPPVAPRTSEIRITVPLRASS